MELTDAMRAKSLGLHSIEAADDNASTKWDEIAFRLNRQFIRIYEYFFTAAAACILAHSNAFDD